MTENSIGHMRPLSARRDLAAIVTLTVFFLLFCALGSTVIYWGVKHAPNCNERIALGRAAAFPLAMLFVHLVGYRLWKRQFSPDRSLWSGLGLTVYRRPMKTALLQQAICSILSALTLDMGEAWHATTIAILAYWMSAGLIVARRLDAPTRGDLLFLRWAFPAIWFSALIIGPIVWHSGWAAVLELYGFR